MSSTEQADSIRTGLSAEAFRQAFIDNLYCAKIQLKKITSSLEPCQGPNLAKPHFFSTYFCRESNRSHAQPEMNATCQETGTPSLDVLHVRE